MIKQNKSIRLVLITALLPLLMVLAVSTACQKQKDIPLYEGGASAHNADVTGMFSVNQAMRAIEGGVVLPDFSTGTPDGIASETGFLLTTGSKNAYAFYNNIIDLNRLHQDGGEVISFEALFGGSYYSAGIEISLVDAFDADRFITVLFAENPWDNTQTLITARSSAGVSYLGRDNIAGGITTAGASTYSNNFSGLLHPNYKHTPFTVKYDPVENCVYTQIEYGKDYLLLDLDSQDDVGAQYLFPGFTTGEVYLRVVFSDLKKSGGIVISSIGGVSAKLAERKNNNILLDMDYRYYSQNTLYSGAVGYTYNLPKPLSADSLHGDISVSTSLTGGTKAVALSGYSFTPTDAGSYTVTYTAADIYGNTVTKAFGFEVLDVPVPILAEFGQYSYSVGDEVSPPHAEVSGGHGQLTVSDTLEYNGQTVFPDRYGNLTLDESGTLSLIITASDSIGQAKTYRMDYTVAGGSLILFKTPVPKALAGGKTVELPLFDAVLFSPNGDSNLQKSVYADTGSGETLIANPLGYAVPTGITEITLNFYGDKGGENEVCRSITLDVVQGAGDSLANLMLTEGVSQRHVTGRGAEFTVPASSDSAVLCYPFALSATFMDIGFYASAADVNYNYIELRLTDAYNADEAVFRVYPRPGISLIAVQDKFGEFSISAELKASAMNRDGGLFYLIYNNENGSVLTRDYARAIDIKYLTDGMPFDGFMSDAVFLTVTVGANSAKSVFALSRLSNQEFKENATDSGPALAFSGEMPQSQFLKLGDVFHIPKARGYDVLSGEVREVSVRISRPRALPEDVDATGHDLDITVYGNYILTFYVQQDSLGNETVSGMHIIHVYDAEPPAITVNGTIKAQYKANTAVTLPGATVTDNLTEAEDLTVYVVIHSPDDRYRAVAPGSKYTFTQKGTYTLIYYAVDATGNAGRVQFNVEIN